MSRTRTILAALTLLPVLAGCNSSWPPRGQGGIAELRPSPVEGEARTALASLACLRVQIDLYRASGHGNDANADLPESEMLADRTAREIHGGLLADGRIDLVRLRERVLSLAIAATLPTEPVLSCLP